MELQESYDYSESHLSPEEQADLNALRRLQFERAFNDRERQRFFELSEKEGRNGKPGLIEEEKAEYLQLTREQTESRNWTPEKANRLLELQKKM